MAAGCPAAGAFCPNEKVEDAPPLPDWNSAPKLVAPVLLPGPNKLGAATDVVGAEKRADELAVPNWNSGAAEAGAAALLVVELGVPNWKTGTKLEVEGAPNAAWLDESELEPNLNALFDPKVDELDEPKVNTGAAADAPDAEVEEAVGCGTSENRELVVVGAEPKLPNPTLELWVSDGAKVAPWNPVDTDGRDAGIKEESGLNIAVDKDADVDVDVDVGGAAGVGAMLKEDAPPKPEPAGGALGAGIR